MNNTERLLAILAIIFVGYLLVISIISQINYDESKEPPAGWGTMMENFKRGYREGKNAD